MSWFKPGDEVVAHLRRQSASVGEFADWAVVVRPASDGAFHAVKLYGRADTDRPKEVSVRCDSKQSALKAAEEAAAKKLKDDRYVKVVPGSSPPPSRVQQVTIAAELWEDAWPNRLDRLLAIGLTQTSDRVWTLPAGTGSIRFIRQSGKVLVTGVVPAEDLPGRVIQACVAQLLGAGLALSDGTPDMTPEEWVGLTRSLLSEQEVDRLADFGLLPKRINFKALAAKAASQPWGGLV
jgi:hypothetical protein